jgi:UDPglucose 6-dehydrogenase
MANLSIWGTWHLGSVHAACLAARGNRIRATDLDPRVVAGLREGTPPLYEPGLAELLREQLESGRLTLHSPGDPELGEADAIFLAPDTDIDEDDGVQLASLEALAEAAAGSVRRDVPVVVASQVPVGTTERLVTHMSERSGRALTAIHVPENLRLGTAVHDFLQPDRLVIGSADRGSADSVLESYGLDCPVLRMTVRSAEMSKHALNAYLATLISFASELSDLCEASGADAYDVERALRADSRVSPKAPLRPGFGFAGGTLGRDVQALRQLARGSSVPSALMDAVLAVNRSRTGRLVEQLSRALGGLAGRAIALLGLTYKPGTDTLRRSVALELARALNGAGARVTAFDPRVSRLPPAAPAISLAVDALGAARGADAVVVVTGWPEFAALDWARIGAVMRRPLVLDLRGVLDPSTAGIELRRIGVAP